MRISDAGLRQMRGDRSGRILVTGATGFLGSHIAAALLGQGYRVSVLARPAKGVTARERVARRTAWLGLDDGDAAALEIVETDILAPGGAAAVLDGRGEAGRIDEIVHCASNTAFSERKRAEVEAANIDGLRRVLDLAVRSGSGFFHHVSTAYVAGRRSGVCREEWVEEGPFTNIYEETKARGEIMAREVCRREGIRLNVYRPTIVCGDSRTGRTLRFNALYFPVKAAVFLRDIYLEDIRERGGRKAAGMGLRLTDDGTLFLPLRIEAGDGGGIDLVPVDHCVGAFMAIFEDGLDGGIYHIVNRRPTRIDDLVSFTRRRFRLEGLETCRPDVFAARPRSDLERLYGSYLEPYRPYMADARSFDDARAAAVLEKRGLACPEFDYGVFARCMDYAVETDWGAKLFPQ